MKRILFSLLIASGVTVWAGSGVKQPAQVPAQSVAPQISDAEARLEKEYEKWKALDEESKKRNPKTYLGLVKKANDARLKAYKNARAKLGEKAVMTQAKNPYECKYYSTEGICSLPLTLISPYPAIAHVNTVLNYKFPKQLADCKAAFIQVYDTKEAGYSIRYTAPDTGIDVYIYDMPLSMYKEELLIVDQLYVVSRQIPMHSHNIVFDKNISEGQFKNGNKLKYYFFYAQFEGSNFGKANAKSNSFALVFAKNRKFVKFRITQNNSSRKDFEQFVGRFIDAFDNKVILDSQTRSRKFVNEITYPIVYSW